MTSNNIIINYANSIYKVTDELLSTNRVVLLGQGVDDFKGLWGTTLGLKKTYPDKIFDTPLSEESIAGICLGMSLNGLYPINTHIRADFSLLMFNQLINMGAKYKYMFGGLFSMPSLFRLVVGRSWGQGAQHSQSFQSMLGHIPGLRVFMPATSIDIFNCYRYSYSNLDCPVVIFEHRLLYDINFECEQVIIDDKDIFVEPRTKVERNGTDITIVATSIMVIESLRVAETFHNLGIDVEVINSLDITFPSMECIIESVKKTGLLIVVDTSWLNYGVGSEIFARLSELGIGLLAPPKRLGMQFSPCPTSHVLEDYFYSGYYEIYHSVFELMKIKSPTLTLPEISKVSTVQMYKKFKGPF
jgi:pyruvate dehydrogenase E1 component beta subunit